MRPDDAAVASAAYSYASLGIPSWNRPRNGSGDLGGGASGQPQQLVVGGWEDRARGACSGPDLAVAAERVLEDVLDGRVGSYRGHAPDRESRLLDDELGIGERDRRCRVRHP